MAKDLELFQPHDALFKSTMQNVSMAKELVREYFPKDQLKVMDLDTMRLESSDFLHDNLRRSQADVLYSLETTQGLGYIYTLVEHQSSPDPQMPLRILEYQVQIMQKHLKKGHEALPLVFPMVVYAGKQKPYPEKTDLYEMFENPELAKKFMFKPFKLIDLTTLDDQEIAKGKYTALMLWALKLRAMGQIKKLSSIIIEQGLAQFIQNNMDSNTVTSVLLYTLNDPSIADKNSLIESIKALGKDAEEIAMTLAEKFKNEGMQKGMQAGRMEGMQAGVQKGMQEGMQKGMQAGVQKGMQAGAEKKTFEIARNLLSNGLEDQFISSTTGLEIHVIQKLKKETVS